MNRTITTHHTNECNRAIDLTADAQGSLYSVAWRTFGGAHERVLLPFQYGELAEVGNTGATMELLLAIVIDKLKAFQAGQWACPENADALVHARICLAVLEARTRAREERGVEGTHQP